MQNLDKLLVFLDWKKNIIQWCIAIIVWYLFDKWIIWSLEFYAILWLLTTIFWVWSTMTKWAIIRQNDINNTKYFNDISVNNETTTNTKWSEIIK